MRPSWSQKLQSFNYRHYQLFPSKPLGAYGDAGACFTSDPHLANRIRCISRHGQIRRYFHAEVGVNGRIDTLQAAVLLAKLEAFPDEVHLRRQIGTSLSSKLKSVGVFRIPELLSGNTSMYAQFTIQVNHRSEVQAMLNMRGVPTSVHYPTLLCQQPAFATLGSCRLSCSNTCKCPSAQFASQHVLSLPMHPYLSVADQDYIASAVSEAVSSTNPC